jgi:YidC/Oxa1 family membrane protein insertase
MPIWSAFVDFLVMILVTLSQAYGGSLGLAIVTVSLGARLLLLPIMLKLARRAQKRQAKLLALQPEIEQINKRFRSNPERLSQEMSKLYSRRGVSMVDSAGLLGGLAQLPVFAGLYWAISQGLGVGGRFLWIGSLAQPDLALTMLVAGITLLTGMLTPDLPPATRNLYALLPTVVTVVLIWQLAAGLGLYWATSSAVGLLQTIILRRTAKSA